jgi:hypothetical protein
VGELVEEQHKGGREPIWGLWDQGLTRHGHTTTVALGGRRPTVGGRMLGQCHRLMDQEASRGRREA